MSDAHGIARDQLRAFISRIERLEEEKKTIADDIKDVYGEAKGMGFYTVIMKRVISLRKKDEQKRMEEEAVLDTYLAALGMLAQHDLFEPEPAPTTNKPAMALRSPRQSAEAVSERTAINPVANVEEGATGAIAAASDDPASRTDEDSERQHSSTVGFADDCRTGGKEQSDASAAPVGDAAADAHGIPATNPEMDRATEGSFETGSEAAENARKAITAEGPTSPEDGSVTHAGAGEIPATHSEIDPNEDRSEDQSLGGGMSSVGANTGGDHVTAPQYAATHQAGGLVQKPPAKPLRPHCLRPENCGGYGSNHCFS